MLTPSGSIVGRPNVIPPPLAAARSYPVLAQAAGVRTSLPTTTIGMSAIQAVPSQKFGSSAVLRRESQTFLAESLGTAQFSGSTVLRRESHSPLSPRTLSARGSHRGTASVPVPATSVQVPSAGYVTTGSLSATPTPRTPMGMSSTKSVPLMTAGSLNAPLMTAGSLNAPVLTGSLNAPVLSTAAASTGTQSEPVRAAQSGSSSARSVQHLPRSSSRSNMEVWATAPSPLRQGISPRSVSVVDKMRTTRDVGAEDTRAQSGRFPVGSTPDLTPRAPSEVAVPSVASSQMLFSAAYSGGLPCDGVQEDSSEVGVTIEVEAEGASTEVASNSAVGRLFSGNSFSGSSVNREYEISVAGGPSQLLPKGIIEEDSSASAQETATEGAIENEKSRTDSQAAALQKHIDRQKRARDRKIRDSHGRISPMRNELPNDSQITGGRCRRAAVSPRDGRGDGSASPRCSGRGLPQSRSSVNLQSRGSSPSQRERANSPKAKGFRWQHGTPVLSPRSEGRSTKNARLPGNILARLKQVNDTA